MLFISTSRNNCLVTKATKSIKELCWGKSGVFLFYEEETFFCISRLKSQLLWQRDEIVSQRRLDVVAVVVVDVADGSKGFRVGGFFPI